MLTVDRFVEKPDRATAERFLADGNFLLEQRHLPALGARAYLDELARINPAMLAACERAMQAGQERSRLLPPRRAAFADAPSLSIDHAVMEHTNRAAVVPVDMAWSDVGSWHALREIGQSDDAGNVLARRRARRERVRNSYIRSSEGRLVAAVGLDNRGDRRDRRRRPGRHRRRGRRRSRASSRRCASAIAREPDQHTTGYRPWGNYRTVDAGDRFQVKRITVKPGGKLSLQKHYHRAEHWVVVHGTAIVQRGEERMIVRENESVYIPIGTEHRLENPGKLPLQLIEVQSGPYLGEDDIVRVADSYGRA